MYCPKCKSFSKGIDVGTRMRKIHELPFWEVEMECPKCNYRIWLPCKGPTGGKDEKNNSG